MGAGAIPINIEKVFRERAKRKHKLQIFTADAGYEGDDCIDVSFHGGHSLLSPPKHLLLDYRLGKIDALQFQKKYFTLLENSFVQHQYTWDDLLNRKHIVLVCSCNRDDAACHRHFIIKFLSQFGAIFKGKRTH